MGWSDKAAQPSGTILPPPPSYRRPRTGRGERGSWPPVRGQLPILAGATGPPPPPSATCRHPSGTRHTLRAPSGRRVIERGGGGLPRRRRSSSLERDSVGSTQLSPIWLRVVGGGAAQTSQRNVALGYPQLSSCPLAERTMTRSHWVERLPNHSGQYCGDNLSRPRAHRLSLSCSGQ